jgi:hypothetical protein
MNTAVGAEGAFLVKNRLAALGASHCVSDVFFFDILQALSTFFVWEYAGLFCSCLFMCISGFRQAKMQSAGN